MHKLAFSFFFIVFLTLSPLAVTPAEAGQGSFEIFVGEYFSDSPIDEEPIIGVRGGYRFSDSFALQGSLSRVELIHPVVTTLGFDDSAVLFDVSAIWYVNPGKRAEVMIYGGPGVVSYERGSGWRWWDDDYRYHNRTYDSEELASLHAGVGVQINLNDRIYLRPDARARWLEGFSSHDGFERSDVDFEATFAVGWKFGKP